LLGSAGAKTNELLELLGVGGSVCCEQFSKDAMRAWTQVGIKLKVVKDVRKLIAKLIWDSGEEALYDVSEGREQEEQEDQEEQEPQQSTRAFRARNRARK
jgi:hypothetical protein